MKTKTDIKTEERHLERFIALVLRIGVITSGIIVIAGAVLFLIRHGTAQPGYHIFEPAVNNFTGFRNLIAGVLSLRSVSIMEAGVLLLIATPVIRVLLTFLVFAYRKDYLYVVITGMVLGGLGGVLF